MQRNVQAAIAYYLIRGAQIALARMPAARRLDLSVGDG